MKPTKMLIPAYVQKMIAATSGRHYQGLVGKLETLPIPELPEKVKEEARAKAKTPWMLDIGSGWGRWLLAGANAGFVPVGLELKLEPAKVARDLLKAGGKKGFVIVADAGKPPFAPESFDVIWSFSVLQHLHRKRAHACLDRCAQLLKRGGLLAIELPTKSGLRNRFIRRSQEKEEDEWNSWVVRYYSQAEIIELLKGKYSKPSLEAHAFGGIGYLPVDIHFVPIRFKIVVLLSEMLKKISPMSPPLKRLADSLYIYARKISE